ncbi:uncharacterized protein LOC114471981 isoform X2 [Gouania willdenowi]|uniref:uncharacterized protein LOC114471981 isoform X2 n=1 Tax=Gouania willdenowi TaxID=441366 RepID=UPI0010556FAE|nr:uncharacterized protein LOC114471981 isoform X2 [Gouania willdenowi]
MARRSTRLISGGYYNSDEDSDSSTVTNISYRENTVKVFKKKGGNRKGIVSPSAKSRSNARSATPEAEQDDGLSPSSYNSQTESTMRTVAYVSTSPTPRPALTTSSSRGNTPTRPFSEHLQRRSYNGRLSSSSRSEPKEVSQSAVDSSGYSSSEGFYRKTLASVSDAVRAAGVGHRRAISQTFYSLINSASAAASATRSKIRHVTASANVSLSGRMKKACALILLLLLLLLSVWWLLPFVASFFSAMTTTKIQPHTTTEAQPAAPAVPLPPPPNVISSSAELDPDAVSAAVDAKMDRLLVDMQLKQEHLLAEIKRRVQLDIQDMKAQLEEVNSESRLNLKQEVSALDKQISDYHEESQSAAATLMLKMERLEAENAKLNEEMSSIKLTPPPVPEPDTSSSPVHHLTPELEQAMENWFSARVQEHEATRPSQGTDSESPWADRMPDFTLESQGGSVISTRCSETYRSQSACVTLFGFPLWYPSESPRTVIQGHPVLLPGKCWAFHGVQGTLVISLSHPVSITHVTLDHLPRYNAPTGRIDSAPKDFEVYGMTNENEEGTLLGRFTYDQYGEPTQTFELPSPSAVHHLVELRVLTNWGQVEYTCLYRFRVHGKLAERRSHIL